MTKKHYIVEELQFIKENSFKKGISYAASEFDVPGVTLGKSALNKFLDASGKLKPAKVPGSNQVTNAIRSAATTAANRNMGAINPGTVSKALTGRTGLGGVQQAASAAMRNDLAAQAKRQGGILKKAASKSAGTLTNPANKINWNPTTQATTDPNYRKAIGNVVNTGKGRLAGPDTITSGGQVTQKLATGRATKDAVTGTISSLPAGAAGVGASRAMTGVAAATKGTPVGRVGQAVTNLVRGGPKGSAARMATRAAVPAVGAGTTAPAAYNMASELLPKAGELQQKTTQGGAALFGTLTGIKAKAGSTVDTSRPATAGEMAGTVKRLAGQIKSGQTSAGEVGKAVVQGITNTSAGRKVAAKAAGDTAVGLTAPVGALATRLPGVAGPYRAAQSRVLKAVGDATPSATKGVNLDVGAAGKVGQAFLDARQASDASKRFSSAQGALAKFKTDSEANLRLQKSLEGVVSNRGGNYSAGDIASAQRGLRRARSDFDRLMGRKVQVGSATTTRGFNPSGSITKPARTDVKPSLPKPRTPPKANTQAPAPEAGKPKKGLTGFLGGLFGNK